MPALVRRAGRRDLEAIQTLWERLRELQAKADTRLAPSAGAPASAREHREMVLSDPNTGFFVAEDRGKIVGYLHAQIEINDPIYSSERHGTIVDLFVVEEQRRQGVGARLLEYCAEWLHSHNLSEYRVSLPAHAAGAQQFFERHGATSLHVVLSASLAG
jgi:GNAT superfamily N-acetyltransferase